MSGLVAGLTPAVVRATLEKRFGTVKALDVIVGKDCAFLDFATVESAQQAIQASISKRRGGEGGIPIPDTKFIVHVDVRVRGRVVRTGPELIIPQRTKAQVLAFQAEWRKNKAGGVRGGSTRGPRTS